MRSPLRFRCHIGFEFLRSFTGNCLAVKRRENYSYVRRLIDRYDTGRALNEPRLNQSVLFDQALKVTACNTVCKYDVDFVFQQLGNDPSITVTSTEMAHQSGVATPSRFYLFFAPDNNSMSFCIAVAV